MANANRKRFYKQAWFWRIAIYLLLVFTVMTPAQEHAAEIGAPPSPSALPGVALIILAIEAILYFRRRRNRKQQAEADRKSAERAALNARVDALEADGIQPMRKAKAILRDGEQAFFAELGTLHEMKSVSVRHGGASARVRVAKGVSVSFGGGRSTPETKLVELSDGELVATDRRLIFAGQTKSFEATLAKIINIEYFVDAVLINLASREKPYVVTLPKTEVAIFRETFRQILARQNNGEA